MTHVYAGVHEVKQPELLFNNTSSLGGVLNRTVYCAIAAGYRQAGFFKELLALFSKAKENSIQLSASCYCFAIQTCVDRGHWEFAAKLVKEMQGLGLSPSPKLYCINEETQTAGLQPKWHIMLSVISGYKEAVEDEKEAVILRDWQKRTLEV